MFKGTVLWLFSEFKSSINGFKRQIQFWVESIGALLLPWSPKSLATLLFLTRIVTLNLLLVRAFWPTFHEMVP